MLKVVINIFASTSMWVYSSIVAVTFDFSTIFISLQKTKKTVPFTTERVCISFRFTIILCIYLFVFTIQTPTS